MNLIRLSHHNPVATIVAFLIIGLLGFAGLMKMPVQLTPDLNRPVITIINFWRAAAPAELEAEIVEPQEYVIRAVSGVEEVRSSVRAGMSITTIEFGIGEDMQQAFINVINALNQAPPRPREAGEPIVELGGLEESVATLLIRKTDPMADADFTQHQQLIRDYVEPELRKIPGIAAVTLNSEQEQQLHVTMDPYRMAALGINLDTITQAIQRSANMSGGFAEVGRREYTVRFNGQYTPETYGEMIVAYNGGRPVYLKEVADISIGHDKARSFAYRNGSPAYFITLSRANESNTVTIMEELKHVIDQLNTTVLAENGLQMDLSFDSSEHIKRAIELVKGNLGIGIILAMALLYWMVRGLRATLLIGLTIPVSLLAALFVLNALGRSINIISLAGLAFAVGLVMDAAIVVQENFLRWRQQGLSVKEAAIKGTTEVAPALFASTATTVAIFAPVLFMVGVEGQLFFDLAISMAVAVVMSMLSALFLLPVIATMVLRNASSTPAPQPLWEKLGRWYEKVSVAPRRALFWVVLLVPGAMVFILLLMPRTDFLPEAKWEGIMSIFVVPPGANYDVLEREVGQTLKRRLQPYLDGSKQPQIGSYNIAMSAGGNILFVYPEDPKDAAAVLNLLRSEILVNLPDTQAFAFQASLLNMGLSAGRSVYMNFNGNMDDASRLIVERTMDRIRDELPGTVIRPLPGVRDARPELTLTPNNHSLAQAGVDRGQIASMIRAVTNGLYAGEYFDGHERMDIIVRSPQWANPEQLQATPVYTPGAGVQTMGQLTHLSRATGPTQLRRINGKRTLTLAITPPDNVSLDETIEILGSVIAETRPQLGSGMSIELSGGSDDLQKAIDVMKDNFIFAVAILFLLLTALFRSATDSILVLLSMPVSIAGGVLGLQALNLVTFQSLDLLTMIGFVILLGLVVNNAILLVDQTRRGQRSGMNIEEAIRHAIQTRVRPVYMSSLTSVVGMLPLVVIPGVGSEIYRGLAVVIVGGMTLSTVFMLVYMPAALRLADYLRILPQKEKSYA